jgi:acyl carrier protein
MTRHKPLCDSNAAGIVARIRQIITGILLVDEVELRDDVALLALGAQSLDYAEILAALDKEFDVVLPDELGVPAAQSIRDYVVAVKKCFSVSEKHQPQQRDRTKSR